MCRQSKGAYQRQLEITQREKEYDALHLDGQGESNKIAGILHKKNQDDLKENDKIFKAKSKNEGEE